MEILELPPSKILSFQEVQKSTEFNESRTISPNFGFTKNVYWVRFELKNNSNQRDWFIHVSYPLLDKIDFYESKDKDWNHVVTGDSYLFRERPLEEKVLSFQSNFYQKRIIHIIFVSKAKVQFSSQLQCTLMKGFSN